MAGRLIKFTAKAAIAAGAVYATLNLGVWSTSARGTQALGDIRAQVFPATDEYLKKIPNKKCVNSAAVKTWNSGVRKTFNALAAAPDTTCRYMSKGLGKIKEQFSSSASS